jgi:hypothetical protein
VIAINLENWNAWYAFFAILQEKSDNIKLICRCHKCNEERDVNSTKKLQEAAEFLKRHFARAVPEVPEGITKNIDCRSTFNPDLQSSKSIALLVKLKATCQKSRTSIM